MYKERLKKLRTERGLNQDNIAKILDIHRGSYSKYEIEDAIMPTKHLNTLCNYFEVSFDYIFGFTDTRKYEQENVNLDSNKTTKRLKELRKEFNLTQSKFAKSLGTANTTISGYELGTRIIATPFLYDICHKYKISADYLLGKIDYNPLK